MTTHRPLTNKKLRKTIPIGIAIILAIVAVVLARKRLGADDATQAAVFHAVRGPLTITVTESGTIRARDMVIIKNEVEGRRAIISLVPEGTRVKRGDLLVELDASSLIDNRLDQDIRVQNAHAAFINAQETLAVVENQAKSDVDRAHLTFQFARDDLRKYIEGDYPNELKRTEAQITLAEEELIRVRETLKWSRELAEDKYISQTELEADALMEKKRALDLDLARNNLRLLTEFVYKRNMAQLESDVQQSEMALERVKRKARADTVQAQANLKAREAEYSRQKDRLAKIAEQIVKARIVAPMDGQVIYATSAQQRRWNVEPLAEGIEVRERQDLIHLPATASTMAEISIHESNLQKVNLGLPAVITVDALPGRQYAGVVARIAPLPDAQSMWMNPDLKIYNTDIHINNSDDTLRPGMSCQARIVVAEYDDALYIPIQAVIRVGNQPTVYVAHGRSVQPRPVEIGLDNNRMVHILSGLDEGEAVLLTPPLGDATAAESTPAEPEIWTEENAVPPVPDAHPYPATADPEAETDRPADPAPKPERTRTRSDNARGTRPDAARAGQRRTP